MKTAWVVCAALFGAPVAGGSAWADAPETPATPRLDRAPARRSTAATPWVGDLAEQTRGNTDFRRVLHTGQRTQLVVMSLPPHGAIGAETHAHVEQILFIQSGRGQVLLDGAPRAVAGGDVVVVPAGVRHDLVNTSADEPLRLSTVYAPPNHIDGRVHRTREDAEADRADEAFGRHVR